MRDPIRDDDYYVLSATLHYASRSVADVSDPFLHQWGTRSIIIDIRSR